MKAADASGRAAGRPARRPRRRVVRGGRGATSRRSWSRWRGVVAVHVDTADDADEDDDLAWYATQEIPDLSRLPSRPRFRQGVQTGRQHRAHGRYHPPAGSRPTSPT